MSVSRGGRGITLSLKDLRIAKIQKSHRMAPCGKELEAFLSALAMNDGDDSNVSPGVVNALEACLGQPKMHAHAASVQFHLQKFVKRKKK